MTVKSSHLAVKAGAASRVLLPRSGRGLPTFGGSMIVRGNAERPGGARGNEYRWTPAMLAILAAVFLIVMFIATVSVSAMPPQAPA